MPEANRSQLTMVSNQPEDWPALFERSLSAGDLDAILALYEPDATFVQQSGELLIGREQIRQMLTGLVTVKARLRGQIVKTITVGNFALLYTNWEGTTIDPSGEIAASHHRGIEILRRQRDGRWKLIVGDPNGRE